MKRFKNILSHVFGIVVFTAVAFISSILSLVFVLIAKRII